MNKAMPGLCSRPGHRPSASVTWTGPTSLSVRDVTVRDRVDECGDPSHFAGLLRCSGMLLLATLALLAAMPSRGAVADEPQAATKEAAPPGPNAGGATVDAKQAGPPMTLLDSESATPPGLIRLSKEGEVWIDPKRKMVVVDGTVCLRRGTLEMFACPKGTKEHESVVAVNGLPSVIHAGLLAVGAKAGTPVRFRPEYQPPTGSTIEVWVLWRDEQGQPRKVPAQQWIRDVRTKKPMPYDWVFAGSGFWTDDQSGQRRYHGDAGDFICVSNFPTATLDIPVESSQSDEQLLFEAFTDHIPNLGTKVRLVLSVRRPAPTPPMKEDPNP